MGPSDYPVSGVREWRITDCLRLCSGDMSDSAKSLYQYVRRVQRQAALLGDMAREARRVSEAVRGEHAQARAEAVALLHQSRPEELRPNCSRQTFGDDLTRITGSASSPGTRQRGGSTDEMRPRESDSHPGHCPP